MSEQEITSYEDATRELRQIIDRLESSETKIDEIETQIQRAERLIECCKTKISQVELNSEEIIRRLQAAEEPQE